AGSLRASCVTRQLQIMTEHGNSLTNEAALLYRASLYKSAGQAEAALEAYRHCAQLNPLNVRALNEVGILLCESRRLNEGIEYFQRVLKIEPKQPETHANLGTAYLSSNIPQLAEYHFKEALKIDSSLLQARDGLRVLQHRRQRP